MDTINNIVKKLRENRRMREEKINYSELDHDDLIRIAQSGDQKAFEELLSQYDPIIRKQASKIFLDADKDEEDVKQMASIAFWDAVMQYDPSIHKHGFGAFANLIISRKLTDELRKDSTDKRKLHSIAQSLDTPARDDDDNKASLGDTVADDHSDPSELYAEKEAEEAILKYMEDNLSDVEKEVIKRKIAGDKVSKIAEETGMKYKSVENALMRVKNKLAEYMRNRESKKIDESESSVEFSDEEKTILKNALSRMDIKENNLIPKLRESYENYTDSQLDDELESIEDEIEKISNEMKDTHYDDRDDLYSQLKDLRTKLYAMEEFMTDEQYKKTEDLFNEIGRAEDREYEGDIRTDPYKSRGLSRADFR